MTALCVAAGMAKADAIVSRMLTNLASTNRKFGQASPAPDLALGHSWHGFLQYLGPPVSFQDGLTILVSGDIFDDDGLYPNPANLIADLYRVDCLHKIAWLNGSFCIAILDPIKNRVTLITDRLASRSLFVWHDDRRLLASSRLIPLVSESIVPKRLSKQGIAELLVYQRTIACHTQYENIASIPASQVWVWEKGRLQKKTSRKLTWTKPEFTKAEAAEGLAVALTRATARRLSDPTRHGLLMSGGLDSRTVLGAARKTGLPIGCSTVGAWDNTEVELARKSSKLSNVPFKLHHCGADALGSAIAPATFASDGLFSAPINLFPCLSAIAKNYDVMLSGHGLDYTLRGYYLPCKTLKIAGSVTRLPMLRRISNSNPSTIADSLRVGISPELAKTILRPSFAAEFDKRRIMGMEEALSNADIDDEYNNWDAFILHSLGRHYAYSDFVSIDEVLHHRPIAFDPLVFDIYLSMPPSWRAEGKVAHNAMMQLCPKLMTLPDSNTGFSARFGFSRQIALVLTRAIFRRIGLAARTQLPDPTFTHGSWMDMAMLFRCNPAWRDRAERLIDDPAINESGLFKQIGIRKIVSAHMSGKANHKKLLMQLLTFSSWFNNQPFDGVAE